jgi:hypothetical protein
LNFAGRDEAPDKTDKETGRQGDKEMRLALLQPALGIAQTNDKNMIRKARLPPSDTLIFATKAYKN